MVYVALVGSTKVFLSGLDYLQPIFCTWNLNRHTIYCTTLRDYELGTKLKQLTNALMQAHRNDSPSHTITY